MFDRKPDEVKSWAFALELYFAACKLDYNNADATYCCSVTLSLLHGTALQ